MADKLTKKQRSYNMSCIHGKDTKPEIIVRKFLFSKGLRFRKNDKRYPGHPDIVLPKYKTVVFVHGCFWHFHEGCKYAVLPVSNTEFWKAKLSRNRERDINEHHELVAMGWHVIVIWECQLKKSVRSDNLEALYRNIISNTI